mmetsp:Transcript_12875/g.19002  ORF Transcript_12875/g.19002 Transcript_12875/m.19002 type:complete len:253 (-) Transcript_12875:75-833(-)|eukprot:CAMPEP_0113937294 /NCGR_PEP_ID=MMETSP1339-20121228/3945_1 /TAXON_ID=94617 /ORGANISM="Fibrocapsa japonica" /LENGTH=252 /DNA_ID=CAMNT_0000940001 /DNA_START=114 /DNA_END=872 /DNA_ORIENTATION=+ /assembly_acc=CAM_ASM_000762
MALNALFPEFLTDLIEFLGFDDLSYTKMVNRFMRDLCSPLWNTSLQRSIHPEPGDEVEIFDDGHCIHHEGKNFKTSIWRHAVVMEKLLFQRCPGSDVPQLKYKVKASGLEGKKVQWVRAEEMRWKIKSKSADARPCTSPKCKSLVKKQLADFAKVGNKVEIKFSNYWMPVAVVKVRSQHLVVRPVGLEIYWYVQRNQIWPDDESNVRRLSITIQAKIDQLCTTPGNVPMASTSCGSSFGLLAFFQKKLRNSQ